MQTDMHHPPEPPRPGSVAAELGYTLERFRAALAIARARGNRRIARRLCLLEAVLTAAAAEVGKGGAR